MRTGAFHRHRIQSAPLHRTRINARSISACATKKAARISGRLDDFGFDATAPWTTRVGANYFFFAGLALRFSSMAACAAAKRATGTRNGEQLT